MADSGQARPRPNLARILDRHTLPSVMQVLQVLSTYAAKMVRVINRNFVLTRQSEFPENFDDKAEFQFYREHENYVFVREDVDLNVNGAYPKRMSVIAYTKIVQNNRIRAIGQQPPFRFLETADLVGYSTAFPWSVDATTIEPVYWRNSLNPVKIGLRQSKNFGLSVVKEGVLGYKCLKATNHANSCLCLAIYDANNLDFCLFSAICLPAKLMIDRRGPADYTRGLAPKYLNTSLTFFSFVSRDGIIAPRLTCRQPLSVLHRDKAKPYFPPYAHIDFEDNQSLLTDVVTMTRKSEFHSYTRFWTSEGGFEEGAQHWHRHHPVPKQFKNPDIRAAGHSMDWILSNSVHVSPFWGYYECCFCDDRIIVLDIGMLVAHLAGVHRKLITSVFSCPVCTEITPLTWKGFKSHYRNVHASAAALAVVLNELNVSPRACFGMALSAVQSTLESFGLDEKSSFAIELDTAREPDAYASPIGGFVNIVGSQSVADLANELGQRIASLRSRYIPDGPLFGERKRAKKSRSQPIVVSDSDSEDNETPIPTASKVKQEKYYSGRRIDWSHENRYDSLRSGASTPRNQGYDPDYPPLPPPTITIPDNTYSVPVTNAWHLLDSQPGTNLTVNLVARPVPTAPPSSGPIVPQPGTSRSGSRPSEAEETFSEVIKDLETALADKNMDTE